MAKMVGLSRNMKPTWLNKCVELVLAGKREGEMKDALSEYLSFEIKSATNLRKTRELLMNIWFYPNEDFNDIRLRALETYAKPNTHHLALHWCMMLLRYPVFAEICSLIGKASKVQGEFTVSWLKESLYEAWGERSTLLHSSDKILRTLRDLGVIVGTRHGAYAIQTTSVADDHTKRILVDTILALKEKAYYEPAELMSVAAFFPFEFEVSLQWIHEMGCFHVGNFGGNTVLLAK